MSRHDIHRSIVIHRALETLDDSARAKKLRFDKFFLSPNNAKVMEISCGKHLLYDRVCDIDKRKRRSCIEKPSETTTTGLTLSPSINRCSLPPFSHAQEFMTILVDGFSYLGGA